MLFDLHTLYLYGHKWSGHLLGKYCRRCRISYKDFLKDKRVCPKKTKRLWRIFHVSSIAG